MLPSDITAQKVELAIDKLCRALRMERISVAARSGRHFLQIPGPTNIPDRVLRALSRPTIDHRGPEFAELTGEVIEGLKIIFGTKGRVIIYPASASGGWEAALVNTLTPGDRVLIFEQGHFAAAWADVATRLGLEADLVPSDQRRGVDPQVVGERLAGDRGRRYKAVLVLHNETSTGVISPIPEIRKAIDRADHPALLIVDTVSSLGSMEYRHDEWGVDVTISGSQKGLMLPPGLAFNAISEKALQASTSAGLARSYWDWDPILESNRTGVFPYTPATNLLFGLREALIMLHEEGLEQVFARHNRLAAATRQAVEAWGLEVFCLEPAHCSSTITAVLVPDGVDADELRKLILQRFDMSLGTGLGALKGKGFRIGHLGDFNDLMLAATLSGIEMGLAVAGVTFNRGGVTTALEYLSQSEAAAN